MVGNWPRWNSNSSSRNIQPAGNASVSNIRFPHHFEKWHSTIIPRFMPTWVQCFGVPKTKWVPQETNLVFLSSQRLAIPARAWAWFTIRFQVNLLYIHTYILYIILDFTGPVCDNIIRYPPFSFILLPGDVRHAMPYCGPSGSTETCRWANIPPGDEVEVEFDLPVGCKAAEARMNWMKQDQNM